LVVAVVTIEGVITRSGGDDVVQPVAVADEVADSGVGQILDISAKRVAGQRGLHGVRTAT
jgi:hypothetical protein